MGAFEFQALDARGQIRQGTLEGDSARHVRDRLRERGLSPLRVDPVAEQKRQARADPTSLPEKEIVALTRQLATLVRAGTPLGEALGSVAEQTTHPKTRRVLLDIRSRVSEGLSLSQALGAYPRIFRTVYLATITAGEQAGRLDEVLESLANHAERRQELRQKLLLSLTYPIAVLAVAIGVVAVMMIHVVPEVVQVFSGIGQELPAFTQALIATSDLLRKTALPGMLVVIATAFIISAVLRNEAARRSAHRLLLRAPVFGRAVRMLNGARFLRTLGILTASAVPLLDAVRIASQAMPNLALRGELARVAQQIREGGTLVDGLRATRAFEPLAMSLIGTGESSGRLPELVNHAAAQSEREIEMRLAMLVGLLEPLVIVLLGGVVLAIVIAILLPIFQLNQLVVI